MLHPDQVKEKLAAFQVADGTARRLRAVARLPEELRTLGRHLLHHEADGDEIKDWSRRHELRQEAAEALDNHSPAERAKVFAALFPKAAPHLEAAWQLWPRLPYQGGYVRKAFRAPNSAGAVRARRGGWFGTLLDALTNCAPDVVESAWLATYAPYLGHGWQGDQFGYLLAAVIDAGGPDGDAVFDILCASGRGEHEIGAMGRHVSRALLVASRPDGWEFMEKMLLAAQRQEGLRQTILETIDESHPEAFRRMLRLIRDHDLARFSSVVRAVDVWLGFQWDSVKVKEVNAVIDRLLLLLDDAAARAKALAGEPQDAYLALWSLAFTDAQTAIAPAAKLLRDGAVERRFAAVTLLTYLGLPDARPVLLDALDDDDLRVALGALQGIHGIGYVYGDEDDEEDEEAGVPIADDLFERLERLLPRLPAKPETLKPLVWPWTAFKADRRPIAGQLSLHLGKRPATRLIPHLPLMSSGGRAAAVRCLTEQKKWDAETRETLFALAGDSSSYVRDIALGALKNCNIRRDEAGQLEGYLTRKAADLRRGVVGVLLTQPCPDALTSSDRLLASGDLNQRLGGLELLRQLAEAGREPGACRQRAEAYQAQRSRLGDDEQSQLRAILDTGRPTYTLDDALGLMNPADRTPVVQPKRRNVTLMTPAALACLEALDELIHEHRETPIQIETWQGAKEELLGNVSHGFPHPDQTKSGEEDAGRLPLREVWEKWWADRPKNLRDPDGFELIRALASLAANAGNPDYWEERAKKCGEMDAALDSLGHSRRFPGKDRSSHSFRILAWLLRLHPPAGLANFLLDAVETSFAAVPESERRQQVNHDDWNERQTDWRSHDSPFAVWLTVLRKHRWVCGEAWKAEHDVRLYRLLRWLDEPAAGVARLRPEEDELLAAFEAGGATEADVLDQMIGPRPDPGRYSYYQLGELRSLTSLPAPEILQRRPDLAALVDRCRERILEIELQRGEGPTVATPLTDHLGALVGVETLTRLLRVVGPKPFDRKHQYGQSRLTVFSRLIHITHPAQADTPAAFAGRMKADGVAQERLIELAFLAPQWARHVEHALGWPGFTEGVWWFLAHMGSWNPGMDHEEWQRTIAERTALTDEERREGAIDVAWFQRAFATLGPKRWKALTDAAKLGTARQDYKKAQLLADVLLGKAKRSELVAGVRRKKLREYVRLLGLLPLPAGTQRDGEILARYRLMQEYRRYAKALGAMSRESALRAAAIGFENLARTAGYPDPVRLEWAMEAKEIADLADGPVSVTVQGVTVSLGLDPQAQPTLTAQRGDKVLKSVPAEVRKHPKVAALAERKADLKRQASRMKESLEAAMCRGDAFTGAELRQLFEHPLLAPVLERLVLTGEAGIGYPVKNGQALRRHDGAFQPVKKNDSLRIAHAQDLFDTDEWHDWQHECFAAGRVQPFKQVFRELYVVTKQEKRDGAVSHRYAGQQVNPQQANALFATRGWGTRDGVWRTFHDAGLTASVSFKGGWLTPLEVEGLTLEGVQFTKRGDWKPVSLADVPPRVFSEAMRDLDLVVSVAHRGGVDPEASASTVEMRAALLRETCDLLGLKNVRQKSNHALIKGELGDYTVHLGSAVVHRQPGGSLCIVPVHSQHRGRLFLPFADDDPRTAEVISKVLLLARDTEIQDPGILDQLRSVR